jgi:hypothetical protein
MKIQRILVAVTVINLGLLLFVLTQVIPPVAEFRRRGRQELHHPEGGGRGELP